MEFFLSSAQKEQAFKEKFKQEMEFQIVSIRKLIKLSNLNKIQRIHTFQIEVASSIASGNFWILACFYLIVPHILLESAFWYSGYSLEEFVFHDALQ